MPSVLVANANVYKNITVIHISTVVQSAYSVLIVMHQRRVFKENV